MGLDYSQHAQSICVVLHAMSRWPQMIACAGLESLIACRTTQVHHFPGCDVETQRKEIEMRIYLIDGLFEVKAKNEKSARNKAEKKLKAAITSIVDITDEDEEGCGEDFQVTVK